MRSLPWKAIWVLALGAVVVAGTVHLLFPRPPEPDPGPYRFIHCSKCGHEYPYRPDLESKSCPYCGEGGSMVPTSSSVANAARRPNPYAPMLAWVMVELVVVMAILVYISRPRLEKGPVEADYLRTHCSHCGQKLRFEANKGGKPGQCPRCKSHFVFPT